MDTERAALLEQAKQEGLPLLTVVHRIKEAGLFEPGKEFNVAVDLKSALGLTTFQLHDIVAWLRGAMTDDQLERSLSGK